MVARACLIPELNLLISQFHGEITDELFIRYYETLISLDAESPMPSELVDFRAATKADIKPYTLSVVAKQIADNYPLNSGVLRCAVVAPSDLGYGLSRMYEQGKSPANVELNVFRSFEDAVFWLMGPETKDLDAVVRDLESQMAENVIFEL
jgi:hypothetical protein